MASERRKPNGQFVVPPGRGEAFVEVLPVKRFHGVGPVTAEKMNRLGIETGADLKRQSLAFLQHHFGKSGAWYYGVARGEDPRPVNPDRERRSSGSETTFASDLVDPAAIEAGVDRMADEVWAWCEKVAALGRTVTVKVKWANFQQSTRSRSFKEPVASKVRLREIARLLVRSLYPPTRGVRLLGVTLSNLEKASPGIPSWTPAGELAL
ncbi:DNA polymerase thumb domain-containing protein [Brevundimonas diminuta]|uniref:DinB/UmuC family translesion DNA polymerase n=1 Tax=Brevundimonas diminuta TaxID=293 RepID=UPI00320B8F9F